MKRNDQIVLAIDFDETIAKNNPFPNITGLLPDAIVTIQKLFSEGYYIIIWSCRHAEHEDQMRLFLTENNIPYHQINAHHPDLITYYQNDTRKVSADIYIDDKCLLGLPPWEEIYHLIKSKHIAHPILSVLNN